MKIRGKKSRLIPLILKFDQNTEHNNFTSYFNTITLQVTGTIEYFGQIENNGDSEQG